MLKWVAIGIFVLLFALVVLVFINSVYHEPLTLEQPKSIGFSDPIIFVSDRDQNQEIYATDRGGEQNIRITNNQQKDFLPAQSPDNNNFVYFSEEDGGYVLRQCKSASLDCDIITYTRNLPKSLLFSPDGQKLLIKEADNDLDSLWQVNLQPAKAELVDRGVELGAWSLDGQAIFFQKNSPSDEIWVRTLGLDNRLGDPYKVASDAKAPLSDLKSQTLIYLDFSATTPVLTKSTLRGEVIERLIDLPDLQKIDKIRLEAIDDSTQIFMASFGLNTSYSLVSLAGKSVTPLPIKASNVKCLDQNTFIYEQNDQLGQSQLWIWEASLARQLTRHGNNWLQTPN